MATKTFAFIATVLLEMTHTDNADHSTHRETQIMLQVSPNLKHSAYLNDDDLPTQAGCEALTMAFVQGLIANIKNAHTHNYWKDYEHIKYIIEELERGFVANGITGVGVFGNTDEHLT